jgi:erythromycin esterase-like protein
MDDNQIAQEIFDRKVTQAIDAKKHQMNEALREIEGNTRKNYEAHVTYHKLMAEAAREHGDFQGAMRHQVMIETYESILRNFTMSGSYDKA